MGIFIYFAPKLTHTLDDIECALEDALGEDGEVTGTGTGEAGANIDIGITGSGLNGTYLTAVII